MGKYLPLLFLPLAAAAHAQDSRLSLRHGVDGSAYESDSLSLRLGPRGTWERGVWTATLQPEFEFTRFRHTRNGGDGPDKLDSLGVIALGRFQRQSSGGIRPYGELGIGLSAFEHDRLGSKGFSTHYQFSEHIGLGVEMGERWFVGWRFSHYSNGHVKRPNDGMDMHQIVIGIGF